MKRMAWLSFKTVKTRVQATTFYKWHRDFLKDESGYSNFGNLAAVLITLSFGQVINTAKIPLFMLVLYVFEFWMWSMRNMQEKQYIQTKLPWENDEEEN